MIEAKRCAVCGTEIPNGFTCAPTDNNLGYTECWTRTIPIPFEDLGMMERTHTKVSQLFPRGHQFIKPTIAEYLGNDIL